MDKILIYAIAGPAGAGKDTIINHLLTNYPSTFHKIVSCTTRPPRDYEIEGEDYHFLTEDQFIDEIESGNMVEWCSFNNWYYGTRFSDLACSEGIINIGAFNPTGVKTLKQFDNSIIDTKVYYVAAPDKMRLIRQLNREKNPDIEEILRRYQTDKKDFHNFNYDIILNNNGSYTLGVLTEIIATQARWAKDYS